MEAFINGTEDIRQPTSKPRIRPRNSRIRSRKTGHSTVTQTVLSFWRSCGRALLMYSFKYNQQDATLYNILYCCQCSAGFGRFLRPKPAEYWQWHWQIPLAVTASKPGTYQMMCVQFLSSWWWAEKPPETCTALTVTLTNTAKGSSK